MAAELDVAKTIAGARVVDPLGSGTHREVGGPPPVGAEPVRAPAGIVSYEPADLTVCLGAGTTVAELQSALGEHGQECALDPRDDTATVGGTLATGLSGMRRLRVGPVRDQVLEVRMAIADGRLVRGGGPTVKNVTGYDLPRLFVGSLGTVGVATRVILRCRPRPAHISWGSTTDAPEAVAARCFRPSAVVWDGERTRVLTEGHEDDVRATAERVGLHACDAPPLPDGPHRGRASVPVSAVVTLGRMLAGMPDVRWLAEIGVGTIHIAADTQDALQRARDATARAGGWMLREAGARGLDGFGVDLPNADLMARVRDAFDPDAKLAPGRLPFPPPRPEGETG
ncbi:MAG TPA: FAD-binding protein [Acidimicrobiia bacterium]|jgi:glycolate oxidase FAD binding subunit